MRKLDFDFADFGLNFDFNFDADVPNIAVEEDTPVPEMLQNIQLEKCNGTI